MSRNGGSKSSPPSSCPANVVEELKKLRETIARQFTVIRRQLRLVESDQHLIRTLCHQHGQYLALVLENCPRLNSGSGECTPPQTPPSSSGNGADDPKA